MIFSLAIYSVCLQSNLSVLCSSNIDCLRNSAMEYKLVDARRRSHHRSVPYKSPYRLINLNLMDLVRLMSQTYCLFSDLRMKQTTTNTVSQSTTSFKTLKSFWSSTRINQIRTCSARSERFVSGKWHAMFSSSHPMNARCQLNSCQCVSVWLKSIERN